MARIHSLALRTREHLLRPVLLPTIANMKADGLATGDIDSVLAEYRGQDDTEILELVRDFHPRMATQEWADRKLARDYGYAAYWPDSEWHAPAPLAIFGKSRA